MAETRNYRACDEAGALACGATTARAASARGLALVSGHTYYFCVKAGPRGDITDSDRASSAGTVAVNATGATRPEPDTSCSNGIKAIAGGPSSGIVVLGHRRQGQTNLLSSSGETIHLPQFQSSPHHLDIRWTGFAVADAVLDRPGQVRTYVDDGIRRFHVLVGSAAGLADVAGPFEVGSALQSVHLRNLTLHAGSRIIATVLAEDYFGAQATAYSAPLVVDPTPPRRGTVTLSQAACAAGRRQSDFDDDHHDCSLIRVTWTDFVDDESGVAECSWALGTEPLFADLAPFISTGFTRAAEREVFVRQGHSLVATVRCFNRAGLASEAVSHAHVVSSAAPSRGWVHDGPDEGRDADFQVDTDQLWARWGGFSTRGGDAALAGFLWGAGTQPGLFDLIPERNVGQARAAHAQGLSLTPGQKYFITVRACSLSRVCRAVSTDGIIPDPSPPAPGVVLDGGHTVDQDLQAFAGAVTASWPGFHDQESNIAGYRWCLGSAPGRCDVRGMRFVGTATRASTGDVTVGASPVYATVQAINGAGLITQASSDGVAYDEEPPVVIEPPRFVPEGVIANAPLANDGADHQLSRTILRMRWRFADAGGRAMRYWYTVDTHHDGASIINDATGLEDGAVLAGLDLSEGDALYLQVTACDASGRCTRVAAERPLVIEATAPTAGSLVDDMSWSDGALTLVWEGFTDPHTSVVAYDVEVGTLYGTDNVVAATRLPAQNNQADIDAVAPGASAGRESAELLSQVGLRPGMLLHIAVRGVNSVGLTSRLLAGEARVMAGPSDQSGGVLQLILHQCESIYCDQRCNCGPFGICPRSPGPAAATPTERQCHALRGVDAAAAVPHLDLRDSLGNGEGQAPVNMAVQSELRVLGCRWNSTAVAGRRVQYIAGFAGQSPGAGLFELSAPERITWFEGLGRQGLAVLPTRDDLPLVHGQRYVFYLRVWLDQTTYAEFKTAGVVIDAVAPFGGRGTVSERVGDFTSNATTLTVSWFEAFGDEGAGIAVFEWGIGTHPGSTNVQAFERVGSSVTHAVATGLTLVPGKIYYAIVRAIDHAGLAMWRVSDGVVVDLTPPEPGIVVDGLADGSVDIDAVPDGLTHILASWQGFVDLESGIAAYEIAVGLDNGPMDALMAWRDVGGNTSVSLPLSGEQARMIGSGSRVRAAVRAVNGNGGRSAAVQSDGIIVDQSPPQSQLCTASDDSPNVIRDAPFSTPIADALKASVGVAGTCGQQAAEFDAADGAAGGLWLRAADALARPTALSMVWRCDAGAIFYQREMVEVHTTLPPVANGTEVGASVNGSVTTLNTTTAPATATPLGNNTFANTTTPEPMTTVVSTTHIYHCRPLGVRVSRSALPGLACTYANSNLSCMSEAAEGESDAGLSPSQNDARPDSLPCIPSSAGTSGFRCGAPPRVNAYVDTDDVIAVNCTLMLNATTGAAMDAACDIGTVPAPPVITRIQIDEPLANLTEQRLYAVSAACRSPHAAAPGALRARLWSKAGDLLAVSPAAICPATAEGAMVTLDFSAALPFALPLLNGSAGVIIGLEAERGEVVVAEAIGGNNCSLQTAVRKDDSRALAGDGAELPFLSIETVPEVHGVWSATAGEVRTANVNVNIADNVFFLPPRARLTQEVTAKPGPRYEFDVWVRLALQRGAPAAGSMQGLRLRLGTTYHTTIISRSAEDASSGAAHAWHRLVYHADVPAGAAGLQISLETLPTHGNEIALEIGHPRLRPCVAAAEGSVNITVGAVFHSGVGPLTVSWHVNDEESGISSLMLAAGTHLGGAQLLDFVPVDAATGRAEADGLHLAHNSQVWVQLVADNAAGLRSIFTASPVLVDRTPAIISNSSSPSALGAAAAVLVVKWEVDDAESGVSWCRVGLGARVGLDDLVPLRIAASGAARSGNHPFVASGATWFTHGARIYPVVHCGNGAGLVSQHAVEDSTLVLLEAPRAAGARVVVNPARGAAAAASPYLALPGVQSSSSFVEATFSGFGEVDGHVASYRARLVGPGALSQSACARRRALPACV